MTEKAKRKEQLQQSMKSCHYCIKIWRLKYVKWKRFTQCKDRELVTLYYVLRLLSTMIAATILIIAATSLMITASILMISVTTRFNQFVTDYFKCLNGLNLIKVNGFQWNITIPFMHSNPKGENHHKYCI